MKDWNYADGRIESEGEFDVNAIPVARDEGWLLRDAPDRFGTYRPQVGDVVVYFWQGHRKFSCIYSIPYDNKAYERVFLSPHIECRVADVRYVAGPPAHCCVDLAPLAPSSHRVALAGIRYFDSALPPFIVPKYLVDESRNRWVMTRVGGGSADE